MATTKFEKPLGNDLDLKVDKTSIVNNLTTNDATKVLSAAQGYTLNGNITALDNKLFDGCGTSSSSVAVSDNTDFTVSKPGWLVVMFTPTSGQSVPSAGTLQVGSAPIAMASGSNNVNVDFAVSALVKPNVNYKARAYRCTIKSANLFYD